MIKPEIPENEAERFDRVTRIAKRMFGVSISLVSLIDQTPREMDEEN
jgi:hypothetical protein